MSIPVSTSPLFKPQSDETRRTANFHPSIWGNHFLTNASDITEKKYGDKVEHQRLKEEVKKMLMDNANYKASEKLELIDAIQRLGVSYHFESEIDDILKDIHDDFDDLHTFSLNFRLLRQQGYKTSCDGFEKFRDGQGKFKDSLIRDARGMLSLYEATHLRVHEEEILEEALAFTTTHLESMANELNSPLATQITRALYRPIRKALPRVEARHYFSVYGEDASHNNVLLTFAKLDFNILQNLHRNELSGITQWWKELNVSEKLPFARDRIAELYFWGLGIYFEPEYVLARRILTKVMAMASIIDDIYDVYGTPQELELFTAAVERWEISAGDELPEYMKVCYKALLDLYSEIESNMVNEGRSYRVHYAKEAMKNQGKFYFLESKWLHQKYTPTVEEYMPIALVTTGYTLLSVTSFVGMGDIATKDSFDWVSSEPKIVTAACIVCRLMDDIVSNEFEQERGHVPSCIECYMKQHGATKEEAVCEFQKQVTDAWKDINEECLNPASVPMPLLMRIINLARVMDLLYKEKDCYTHSENELKEWLSSMLVEPVPI